MATAPLEGSLLAEVPAGGVTDGERRNCPNSTNQRPPGLVSGGHLRWLGGIGWQTPAAYAAKWKDESAGAFPTATQAGATVGASPLRSAQPANQHHPILSHNLV